MKQLAQETADTTLDYVHVNHFISRKAAAHMVGAVAEAFFTLGNGFSKAEVILDPDLAPPQSGATLGSDAGL